MHVPCGTRAHICGQDRQILLEGRLDQKATDSPSVCVICFTPLTSLLTRRKGNTHKDSIIVLWSLLCLSHLFLDVLSRFLFWFV